jgi:hypothetical protein
LKTARSSPLHCTGDHLFIYYYLFLYSPKSACRYYIAINGYTTSTQRRASLARKNEEFRLTGHGLFWPGIELPRVYRKKSPLMPRSGALRLIRDVFSVQKKIDCGNSSSSSSGCGGGTTSRRRLGGAGLAIAAA